MEATNLSEIRNGLLSLALANQDNPKLADQLLELHEKVKAEQEKLDKIRENLSTVISKL
jgi:hypothetical protein